MIKHRILNIVGYCAIALGGVGVVIPILPTVPFILLAAICFGTANPKMNKWMSENRYFGEYIENYRTRSGVSRKKKAYSIVLLWAMLSISMIIFRENVLMLAILFAVGIGVSLHIALLRKRQTCVNPDDKNVGSS